MLRAPLNTRIHRMQTGQLSRAIVIVLNLALLVGSTPSFAMDRKRKGKVHDVDESDADEIEKAMGLLKISSDVAKERIKASASTWGFAKDLFNASCSFEQLA